jgi:predicted MPP superfamily phosphohydrolase
MMSRREFLTLGISVLGSAAGLGLYVWRVEPEWVELVRRRMPLENLPHELEGRTLLHFSDIHVGPRVSSEYLIRVLTEARELAPDFIAFTGDFVTYRSANVYRELARVLRSLPQARLGMVAALGNHDYGIGWQQEEVADAVSQVARNAGMVVLRNEVRNLGGLQFAGLADIWSPEFGPLGSAPPAARVRSPRTDAGVAVRAIAPELPTVVLVHNPDTQDLPIWDGVRGWVLAGHTHGGQIKPPFLPPPILPVRNKRYTAGEFTVGPGRTMYINRGLGYLARARFNARPELTLFTLEQAPGNPTA